MVILQRLHCFDLKTVTFLYVKKWPLCWKWVHGFTLIAAINLSFCQHHEWGYFLPSINIGLICIFISKIGKYHMRSFAAGHFRLCSKSGHCCWDFSGNQICYEVPKVTHCFHSWSTQSVAADKVLEMRRAGKAPHSQGPPGKWNYQHAQNWLKSFFVFLTKFENFVFFRHLEV